MPTPETPARFPRAALRALGVLLLVGILATTDRAALIAALRRADLRWLALGFVIPLPAILCRVWRWRRLLGPSGKALRFWDLAVFYAQAIALGVMTPGRIGEFAKAGPLSARGIPLGTALASVLVDRLADLVLLAALAAGFLIVWGLPGALGSGTFVAVAGVLALATLGGVFAARGNLGPLSRFLPANLGTLPPLGASGVLAVAGVTLLSWAITYAGNWSFAQALGLPLGYLELAGISALCSLVASLPVSIAGAGTRDATLLVVLAGFGIARPEILALSSLMLAGVVFVGVVCAAAFFAPIGSAASEDVKGD